MKIRVGMGYDIHRFAEGRPMMLGGVQIPHDRGLDGHSDADALLHAICDALLGAAGLSDIGHHFPNTDPRFHNIDSRLLLNESWNLVKALGYSISNLDCTVVAEHPKVNPHIAKMKSEIAAILGIGTDDIAIKATTQEGIGGLGRGEGLAAYAVVLITRP